MPWKSRHSLSDYIEPVSSPTAALIGSEASIRAFRRAWRLITSRSEAHFGAGHGDHTPVRSTKASKGHLCLYQRQFTYARVIAGKEQVAHSIQEYIRSGLSGASKGHVRRSVEIGGVRRKPEVAQSDSRPGSAVRLLTGPAGRNER